MVTFSRQLATVLLQAVYCVIQNTKWLKSRSFTIQCNSSVANFETRNDVEAVTLEMGVNRFLNR